MRSWIPLDFQGLFTRKFGFDAKNRLRTLSRFADIAGAAQRESRNRSASPMAQIVHRGPPVAASRMPRRTAVIAIAVLAMTVLAIIIAQLGFADKAEQFSHEQIWQKI
ncbi:MAG TPA: hypothetical protein VNF27_11730 [Candidatus Binataceae bacterium]|nr:hypothetical protein [Candidatus Binataceae bacterium]